MKQGFDEFFKENFEDGLGSPSKYMLKLTFEAGAQSRQTEIDELQKRIKKAEKLMRLFFKEDSYEYAISAHDELKGQNHD